MRFVYPIDPWFLRGSMFSGGTGAGVFAFGRSSGDDNLYYGFREPTIL